MRDVLAIVVEDQIACASAFARVLLRQGAEVRVAHDAEELLETMRADEWSRLDVALLDVRLPGLSGTALAAIIRDRNPRTEILLVPAAHDVGVIRSEILGLNVPFLTKPFDDGELQRWAAGACARSQPRLTQQRVEEIASECDLGPVATSILRYVVSTSTEHKDIAGAFGLELSTVKYHAQNIIRKTGTCSLREVVDKIRR